MNDPLAINKLLRLIRDLFNTQELRLFLSQQPSGDKLSKLLPESGISFTQLAADTVDLLSRHGLVTHSLFLDILASFPGREDDIRSTAEAWGFNLTQPLSKQKEPDTMMTFPNPHPTHHHSTLMTPPLDPHSQKLKWLHLTDLHIGMHNERQQLALQNQIEFIKSLSCDKIFDAVIITGDITWSGTPSEYQSFEDLVYRPISSLNCFSNAKWIVIPGNHDLDCELSFAPVWESLGSRRAVFFEETNEGKSARGPRVKSFEAFEHCLNRLKMLGPRPSKNVSEFFTLPSPAGPLGFVMTNTAWFSDRDAKNDRGAPAPLASLRRILTDNSHQCEGFVILGHHPLDDFRYEDRGRLRSLLLEHNAIYLHGHSHQITVKHSSDGIQELGFGAVYQAALDTPPDPFYSNMFAVVNIDRDLEIVLFGWSEVSGRWESASDLPSDFRPEYSQTGALYRFTTPWSSKANRKRSAPPGVTIGAVPPRISGLSYLNVPDAQEWVKLVKRYAALRQVPELNSENVKFFIQNQNDVHFWYEDATGRHTIVCLSGSGRILSQTQVLEANTQLDLEDYTSYTIITFGELAEEARTTYVRLHTKKPLTIIDQHWFVARIYNNLSAQTKSHLQREDATSIEIRIIILSAETYILLTDRVATAWVELYDDSFALLPDHHFAVSALREFKRAYSEAFYGRDRAGEAGQGPKKKAAPIPFDDKRYREDLYNEFNSVRYAPLAAFGFRFSGTTLSDLYIETTAQIEENRNSDAELAKALDEMMDTMQLDIKLREQLRQGLRNAFRLEGIGENDIARRIYQKHGSLLILGTPGSGKTFFAKFELLAYCRPPKDNTGWYSKHVPLYVPLAEAAKTLNDNPSRKLDLIEVASHLPRRASMAIPEDQVRELYAEGKLALFFDGLDEITSLAHRSAVADAISVILAQGRGYGNRVVITSRPSAVQVVQITSELPSMTLCGLDEGQISKLAKKVLRLNVSDGKSDAKTAEEELHTGDIHLLNKLLSDISTNVGIRRLATNPLLLTLLIMVYINSGAPSAKRHRIYQQAVQTLVTIRSRDIGQEVLPESDLRRRLGAVALAVFRDTRSTIPSVRQVLAVLKIGLSRDLRRDVSDQEAREYLQQVADATGIIVLHPDPSSLDLGHVTFMHYSFAEYYAAVGLREAGYSADDVAGLAKFPRWRETIILYAGLLGDYGDLRGFIAALIKSRDAVDSLTLELLMFAFDCALESDVPPDAVQEDLISQSSKAMSGILRYDRELRLGLGERLRRLYATSRTRSVVRFLLDGLAVDNADVLAAYIDVLAVVFKGEDVPSELISSFDRLCKRRDIITVRAVCSAAQIGTFANTFLRCPAALSLFDEALSMSSSFQLAVLQCLETSPQLASRYRGKTEEAMRSDNLHISSSASRTYVEAYTREMLDDVLYRHRLLEAMRNLARGGQVTRAERWLGSIDRHVVELLLASAVKDDRELGLYLLPWVKGEEEFAHGRILEVVRGSEDRSLQIASLSSLRSADSARRLIRRTELAEVRRLVDSGHSDVSIAAVRTLADVGRRDPSTIGTLVEWASKKRQGDHFRECLRLLVWCGSDSPEVRDFLADELERRIRTTRGDGATLDLRQILLAASECDWNGDFRGALCRDVWQTIDNDRKSLDLRVDCVAAVFAMCKVGPGVVDQIVRLVDRRMPRAIRLSGPSAAIKFLQRCRQRFEFLNLVFPKLDGLKTTLEQFGQRLTSEKLMEGEAQILTQCREALAVLDTMINAFREFDAEVLESPRL